VFTYHECDALNNNAVSAFLEEVRPDYILNLIGTFNPETFKELFLINVDVLR
jgi:hypothetical protein